MPDNDRYDEWVARDAGHTPTDRRLIEAAAEVFAERGYDGAGVAEIARRAGLTTGAIYGRFTGKAELLLEAIDTCVPAAMSDVLAGAGSQPAADLLAGLGEGLVAGSAAGGDSSGDALLLEAIVASRREPDLAERLERRFDELRRGLAKLVEEGKADGTIDAALDTDAVVKLAHAIGLGFMLYRTLDTPLPDPDGWHAVVARLLAAAGPVSNEEAP